MLSLSPPRSATVLPTCPTAPVPAAWLTLASFGAATQFLRPALVYYDNLLSQSDYVAEAISHELGHNFGLSHDGSLFAEYYSG